MGLFDGFFGGGSGGNSTSNTTSIDKRMVVDGQGVGVSSDSSTVNLLDAGAFKQAVDFAAQSGTDAQKNFGLALQFAGNVYNSAFSVLDSARQGVAASGDLVAKAYDNAKGQGDQKTMLLVLAGAAIALVALNRVKL